MATATQILAEIKPLGSDGYRKILAKHGVTQDAYGVKVEYLKKILKREKKNYQLALDLFETGVYDAMYLAGLLADSAKMTKKDLNRWLEKAGGGPLCGSTVPMTAAGSPYGHDVALEWIESKKDYAAAAGWATLLGIVSTTDDEKLDMAELKKLLQRVQKNIHNEPDSVRYAMNSFVIALGTYVLPLRDLALQAAEKIGKVSVDMGDTACKVPFAPEYMRKCIQRNPNGKKRASAGC
ncbi:MAG TPA: DNA alkylation repair protein [Planctomycetota bacterium]|nr:DNA alkylation repair protein [Planctomycetota bacterium]